MADSEHTRVCADEGAVRKVSAVRLREELLKCLDAKASRYLKLLVPLTVICINYLGQDKKKYNLESAVNVCDCDFRGPQVVPERTARAPHDLPAV